MTSIIGRAVNFGELKRSTKGSFLAFATIIVAQCLLLIPKTCSKRLRQYRRWARLAVAFAVVLGTPLFYCMLVNADEEVRCFEEHVVAGPNTCGVTQVFDGTPLLKVVCFAAFGLAGKHVFAWRSLTSGVVVKSTLEHH